MFCEKCGKPIEKGSAFCGNCGAKVAGMTPPAGAKKIQPAKKSVARPSAPHTTQTKQGPSIALILVCFFFMIVIGGGGFIGIKYFIDKKDEAPQPTTAIAPTAETTTEVSTETPTEVVEEATEAAPSEDTTEYVDLLAQDTEATEATEAETEEYGGGTEAGEVPVDDEDYFAKRERDYILPYSSERIISPSELDGLTLEEIIWAKNEIYARHGRKFQDSGLQEYFNNKSWYYGYIEPEDFDNSVFSKIESENLDTIIEREKYLKSFR